MTDIPAMLGQVMAMPEPDLAQWIAKVREEPVLQMAVKLAFKAMKMNLDDSPLAAALLNGDVTPEQGARLVKLAGQGGTEAEIKARIAADPMVNGVFDASPL